MYRFLASLFSKIFVTLSFISAAALLVKVRARIWKESTPVAIKWAIRVVKTLVLPLPAPATIIIGPSRWSTASRCESFSPCKYSCMLQIYEKTFAGGYTGLIITKLLKTYYHEIHDRKNQLSAFNLIRSPGSDGSFDS